MVYIQTFTEYVKDPLYSNTAQVRYECQSEVDPGSDCRNNLNKLINISFLVVDGVGVRSGIKGAEI